MTYKMKKLLGRCLSRQLSKAQYATEFRIIHAHQFPIQRRSIVAWYRSWKVYRQIDKRFWYYDIVDHRNIYRPIWR